MRLKSVHYFLLLVLVVSCQKESRVSVKENDLTIRLGDFASKAQLTVPAEGQAPFPGVLLVHPSGPTDMNLTILDDAGNIKAENFKVLAEHLSANGFAVMRYNKRYIKRYDDYDREKYRTLWGPTLLQDVKTVLAEMRAHPLVDSGQIFIYAASQGTRIVPTLALSDPLIKGLILQGPVIKHSRTRHRPEFFRNVMIPYLKEHCRDGLVTEECLSKARNGSSGAMLKAFLGFFGNFETDDMPVLNSELDLNSDGKIDLDEEVNIALEKMEQDTSRPYILKTILELAPELKTPLLILQGESDAMISVEMVETLTRALGDNGHPDYTLKLYAKLGHTLGYAERRVDDDMRQIAGAPLADATAWIKERL